MNGRVMDSGQYQLNENSPIAPKDHSLDSILQDKKQET